jgi:hypothetical protein
MFRTTLILLACLCFLGCAFNRADFVTGPDGKPQTQEMSDDGKTVGKVFQGLRPMASLRF